MSFFKKQLKTIILLSLLTTPLGCTDSSSKQSKTAEKERLAYQTTPVVVKKVPINYRTTGTIVSDHRVDVASRVTGYIKKIRVHEGDRIKKGQTLIILDGANVEGAIRQVTASVDKAKSALKDAQRDVDNFQALFERGSVSENTLRKTKLQRDIAKDTLREATAALEATQSQRQYTQISSPVTGIVVARHKREGDLAAPALPLLTVESSEGLLFETFVAEGQIKHIKHGATVRVTIDALDQPVKGFVARIVQSADPLTRKSQVKVSLPDNDTLLPGMFGRTHFEIGSKRLPVINVESLVKRAGLTGVFFVDEQQRIHFRWLRLGKETDGKIEVLAGLTGGEHIVALPDGRLRDGDFIRLKGQPSE